MGEGTTRDHFAREVGAVIMTALKATRRRRRDPRSAPPCASPPSSIGHTTTAARD